MAYVVKAAITRVNARQFSFPAMKTMYMGKKIGRNDEIFIFASENEGGEGLIALGNVTKALSARKPRAAGRHTPRVSINVKRLAQSHRRLGRAELRAFRNWGDGRPETELCFKLYRQATNKIVAVSEQTARFLRAFF